MLSHFLAIAAIALSQTSTSLPSETFYFGVSNASFQVEGEPADSDWRRWTRSVDTDGRPRIIDGTNADVATSFWRRYDRDFALAQSHGMNAFRISVARERVQPGPDTFDEDALQHYVDMAQAMRRRGLEPFITLQHFVLPGWLADAGGLVAEDYPAGFATFAREVVKRLAAPPANVRWFITLNEPNIQVRGGYLDAHKFPPGIDDPSQAVKALAALAQAHIEAYEAVRGLALPEVKVGVSQNWQVYEPLDAKSAQSRQACRDVQHMFNEAFMDAVVYGKFDFHMPGASPVRRRVPMPRGPALDFAGVQNYGRSYVDAAAEMPGYIEKSSDGMVNDLGWEIVPDALERAVRQIAEYGLPVIITETGVADRFDRLRPQYLRDNFTGLRRLRHDKVPVFGYIHWTLTDNFEWAYGETARFGLADVDYRTQEVTPRPSLRLYHELIESFRSVTDL